MHIYLNYYKKKIIIIKKKKFSFHKYKNFFCLLNIRMVNLSLNLSLNELKLIPERRNISHYENKSTKDLIKTFGWPKSKLGINKNKLKEI